MKALSHPEPRLPWPGVAARGLIIMGLLSLALGCMGKEQGTFWSMPSDHTQADFDRDWHQCAVHAQLSNENWLSGHTAPSVSPLDPQQNLQRFNAHKSTNAMIETCMASRGYRVE